MERYMDVYIMTYYTKFMTPLELRVGDHLICAAKAMEGRTDAEAQREARNSRYRYLAERISDDPEVLALASEGYWSFSEATAKRIFEEHASEIKPNRCPKCGAIARTPTARQCRACFHDWH